MEKFSGREGDNDFEIWQMDFKEATVTVVEMMNREPNDFHGS